MEQRKKRTLSPLEKGICPEKHRGVVRHRRRNHKYQYYCRTCDKFYTENSKVTYVKDNLKYYDKFITDYIRHNEAGSKFSVSALCKEHKISHASIYRHLLSPEGRVKLNLLIALKRWADTRLSNAFSREIIEGVLRTKYKSNINNLTLTFNFHCEVIAEAKLIVQSNSILIHHWISNEYGKLEPNHKTITFNLPSINLNSFDIMLQPLKQVLDAFTMKN